MMHLLSFVEQELGAGRSRELERRLELARQIQEGRPARVALSHRLLFRLGVALIALGQAIQPQEQCETRLA